VSYPWSANDILTAADLNAAIGTGIVSTGLGAWATYIPTLTQSGAVTKTVNAARYMKVGRHIVAQVFLTVTGAGTGGNAILVGLPETAVSALAFGSGYLLDASGGLFYAGVAYPSSTTAAGILIGNGAGVANVAGIAGFTGALASGDVIGMNFSYESAT
jgi:hypothetical protein